MRWPLRPSLERPPLDRPGLVVAGVSVSTRGHSDIRGLVTAGRAVRRELPKRFGPWQTGRKRHARFSKDGTWDQILAALLVKADDAGQVDWQLSVDSTVSRVHQHCLKITPGRRLPAPESHRGTPRTTRDSLLSLLIMR